MELSFRDHEGFHRAAIGMTAAGAAAGALGHVVGASAIVAGAVGAAIGSAVAEKPRRASRIGLGLVMASMGAAVGHWVGGGAAMWIVGATLAIALARGGSWKQWLGSVAVGSIVAVIGVLAAQRIGNAAITASWPAWVIAMIGAAVMSLACVVALVPSRIAVEHDAVIAALRLLPQKVDAEIRDLAEQGGRVWAEVKTRVDDDAGRAMVQDGVLKLVEVAAKSDKIPGDVALNKAKVISRIEELDARIAAATDEIARAQYAEARVALDDQRRYLEGIQTSRDRLVARMHNYLAALEKFRLCVIHVETASAADLELCGKALAELEAA